MAKDDRDYEIGKGKPPKYTRFQKGAPSPNPKGRPRKKVTATAPDPDSVLDDVFREMAHRQVTVRDHEGEHRIAVHAALRQAQIKIALLGSPIALRDVFRDLTELGRRDAERAQINAEKEIERFQNAVIWRERQVGLWAAAEAIGIEPDEPWPHPDDILIDHGKGTWRVRGPLDDGDLLLFRFHEACRDFCFTKAAIAACERPISRVSIAFWDWCWPVHDRILPLRWQIALKADRLKLAQAGTPLRKLRAMAEDARQEADELANVLGLKRDKEAYRWANGIMKPFLARLGYRSLAEFEHAHADGIT